jgi:hypothetical protein
MADFNNCWKMVLFNHLIVFNSRHNMTPIYQITIAIRGGKTEQSVAIVVQIQKQLYSKLEFIVLDLNINYDGAK